MKKCFRFAALLFLALAPLRAADWLEGADYRLAIDRDAESARAVSALDLRRMLLPVAPENGVVVTDAKQEPVPFFLDDRQCLMLPPAPQGRYHVYFGFPRATLRDRWDREKNGAPPVNRILSFKLIAAHGLYASEADWLNGKNDGTNRRFTRNLESQQKALWQNCIDMTAPGYFMQYSPQIWHLLTFYRQQKYHIERYNRFLSLASRAQMWRFRAKRYRRKPVYRCGSWMPIWMPQYQRMNTHYRLRWMLINLRKTSENWRDELARHQAQYPGAPERELIDAFNQPRRRVFGEDIAREINLPKRAFDAGGTFACRYSGALYIPKDGEYEFSVTANSLTVLRLGDDVILRRAGKVMPDDVVSISAKRTLKQGLYPFDLFYLKTRVTTHLTAMRKRPGDAGFAILTDRDFLPAYPVRPLALAARDGGKYPVVERDDRLELFYGKLKKAEFAAFTVLAPKDLRFQWKFNGEAVPSRCSRLVLPEAGPLNVRLCPLDRGYRELAVERCLSIGTRQAVDAGLWFRLDLPMTIKNDEMLNGRLELKSRMPLPVTVRLRTHVSGDAGASFPPGDRYLDFAAKPPEEIARFADDVTHRKTLRLDGRKLEKGVTVEWEAAIPELVFDRKTVRFLPVAALPADLTVSPEGFFDGGGDRIVPVLHRPSLHELRRGESLNAVGRMIFERRKLLIVTEDFGDGNARFSRLLETACRNAGFEPEIRCWKNSPDASGSRMLDSMPELLRSLSGSPADTALLIVPPPSRDRALPDRDKTRLAAMLLEKMRSLPHLRQLMLATPLPAGTAAERETDAAFDAELQTLTREYGAERFDWGGAVLRAVPDYDRQFVSPESDGVTEILPGRAAKVLAELLADLLRRK